MTTEDVFASIGRSAFRFLMSSVEDQNEASRVMVVSKTTVSRWINAGPKDPFGRRTARSWRPTWFGYPSPLPSFDRICEAVVGTDWFGVLGRDGKTAPTVLDDLRRDGLVLSRVVEEVKIVEVARSLDIPTTSLHRILLRPVPWPSQWTALDRLSRKVVGNGWPEFVLSFESDRRAETLPVPGIRCLVAPLFPKIRTASRS